MVQKGDKIRIINPRSYNETLYLIGDEALIDAVVEEGKYVMARFFNSHGITMTGNWVVAFSEFEVIR